MNALEKPKSCGHQKVTVTAGVKWQCDTGSAQKGKYDRPLNYINAAVELAKQFKLSQEQIAPALLNQCTGHTHQI